MKRIAVLSLFIAMAFAGSALACHFNGFTPIANCDGWSVNGSIYFSGTDYADLTYTVTLSDGSATVAEFTGSERIYESSPTFSYGAPWGVELCGDYTATGTFYMTSSTGHDTETFTISFTCICDEPNGCTGTPGYWQGGAAVWNVSELTVGGVLYTKEQLLLIFDYPTRGDATIKLFHHLAAAKLNILHGADASYVLPSIAAGDAFLVTHGFLSKPKGDLKTECNAIKDALVAYNESNPCGDEVLPMMTAPSLTSGDPNQEAKSWGAIKKIYDK